jgi:signal transduction histidine kinase
MVERPSRPVGRPLDRLAAESYQVLVTVYLAGLVIWLVLGLVPSLAGFVPPLHRELLVLGDGHGPFSLYARRVADSGMTLDPPALVAVAYVFSFLNLALGVLLMLKRPEDLVPRLLALAFMGTAATFNEPSHAVFHVLGEPPAIKAFHFVFHVVSGSAYLLAVVLFPRGRLPLGWGSGPGVRRLFVGGLTAVVAVVCWRSSFLAHPPFFVVFFGVLIPVVGIAAQSLHLREHRDVRNDDQSRLLRVALLPALAAASTWVAGHGIAALDAGGDAGQRIVVTVDQVFPAVFAVVPVVLFVAILRHHLWDIDLVASRALLMACLLTFVTLVYVGVVACTGVLLRGHGWAVLVPLVVVACVAEPVRERCEAWCNRLVYGQRMSPRDAIRSLVDHFAGVGEVDELTELTRVVVESTRAVRTEIWLAAPGELVLLARHPTDPAGPSRLPLPTLSVEACREALQPAESWPVRHEGALLAVLSVATSRGSSLTAKESRLIADLSHHAGLLVRNAQLTVDLERELEVVSARAAQLETSRQEVVLAQDRRRRQLERDVHDGAQQQLVALLITLRGRLRRLQVDGADGGRGGVEVDELRSILEESRSTLSRLARGGAPRVLVESGLAAALEEAAAGARRAGPSVQVRTSGSWQGSVQIDSAVYFCCLEALQNAVKHAGAAHIDICLESHGDLLTFAVGDDGAGFDAEGASAGSGLGNLAARVVPLGGRVRVESTPGSGTTVSGEVPAARSPDRREAAQALTGAVAP